MFGWEVVIQFLFVGALFFGFGALELAFPAEHGQTVKGKLRNVLFAAILLVSGTIIVYYMDRFFPIRFRVLPDRGALFSGMVLIAYIFLTDCIFYWYHRAQHAFRSLWLIHELHHSDRELNVTTSMRTYWLERPIQTAAIIMPITFLVGIDMTAIAAFPFIMIGWLLFTHANLRLELGFLSPIFCGPQVHRIHHSLEPRHQGKNFAQFFPLIDIAFGTYYAPARGEFPPTGVPDLLSEASVMRMMVRPFVGWFARISGK